MALEGRGPNRPPGGRGGIGVDSTLGGGVPPPPSAGGGIVGFCPNTPVEGAPKGEGVGGVVGFPKKPDEVIGVLKIEPDFAADPDGPLSGVVGDLAAANVNGAILGTGVVMVDNRGGVFGLALAGGPPALSSLVERDGKTVGVVG